MFGAWLRFSLDATMLAVEAQSVIAMRLASAALGRGSHAETTLMVTEKASALLEAAAALAGGGSTHHAFEAIESRCGLTLGAKAIGDVSWSVTLSPRRFVNHSSISVETRTPVSTADET